MEGKRIVKTLVNCTPTEFLKQTVLLKKKIKKWVDDIGLDELKKIDPEYEKLKGNESAEEKISIIQRNNDLRKQLQTEKMWEIFDNAFEKYPNETLEILALVCFVEPNEIDDYPISEYLGAVNSMINDEAVITFFISLVQLEQVFTSKR